LRDEISRRWSAYLAKYGYAESGDERGDEGEGGEEKGAGRDKRREGMRNKTGT
jgi:hypothetical protein